MYASTIYCTHHSLRCQAPVTAHWLIRQSLMLASIPQRRSSGPVTQFLPRQLGMQCWTGLTGAENHCLHCQYGISGGNARLIHF